MIAIYAWGQDEPVRYVSGLPENTHLIAFTLREGGGLETEITCVGPDNASCRWYCWQDECEDGYSVEVDGDKVVCQNGHTCEQDTCLVIDNLEGEYPYRLYIDAYDGPDKVTVRDGRITSWWNGNGQRWKYADDGDASNALTTPGTQED